MTMMVMTKKEHLLILFLSLLITTNNALMITTTKITTNTISSTSTIIKSSSSSSSSSSGMMIKEEENAAEIFTNQHDGVYDDEGKIHASNKASSSTSSRRNFFNLAANAVITTSITANAATAAAAAENSNLVDDKRRYYQRFPSLFSPLYGEAKSNKQTVLKQVDNNIWFLEQSLEIGPLEVPIRCVVIKLSDNTLWVHAPLAPTIEFFELIESIGGGDDVGHIVVPTYALEHKIFTKDAIERWPNAQLWVSPGQFTFPATILPQSKVSDEYIFGKKVSGVLTSDLLLPNNNNNSNKPSWTNEIEYETLEVGTFAIGGKSQTFYETTFFHKQSKSLIVTDAVAQINLTPPESINNIDNLLLVSKKSTSDPMPIDTPEARQIGWEKTSLLVSYFFPEHEEFDPNKFGVVTWTDGWHDNFQILAGMMVNSNQQQQQQQQQTTKKNTRLIVPPVVRTLLYAENPSNIQNWVTRVVERWSDMKQIIPAHFEAPIKATSKDLQRVFAYLDDNSIDPFPENDLKRGLKPIADIVYGGQR